MFAPAYLAARFLWIPLLACWAVAKGAPRRALIWLPLGVALAATAWELMIPAAANIRIDLLFVAPLLMFADGLGAILIAASIRNAPTAGSRAAMATAAGLCAVACAWFVAAWFLSNMRSEDQYREYVDGSRYWFEAAFADDAAQKAAFGDLEGTRWAGYYVADPADPVHAHLVVNRDGDFFVFGPDFRAVRGRAAPQAADAAVLAGRIIQFGANVGEFAMRDLGGGRASVRIADLGPPRDVAFSKRSPPRFAAATPGTGEVKFKGVFSGSDTTAEHRFVTQMWLWEAGGKQWGILLRQGFPRGKDMQSVGQRVMDVKCVDPACASIEAKVEDDAAFAFAWDGPERLLQKHGYQGRDVVLERGEIVPGFLYERAPLATPEANRKWLRSLHPLVIWNAP
jgi:hypothetical protein